VGLRLIERFEDPTPRLSANQRCRRGLVVACLLALGWWAAWVFDPRNLQRPLFFALLAAVQLLDVFGVLGFWHAVWPRVRPQPLWAPVRGRAAVVVLARDQPLKVIERTLTAALSMRMPSRVILVGRAGRDDLPDLADRLEVGWLADGTGGVAEGAGTEFLAVVEAGQDPHPDFLDEVLPYFANRHLAMVQTRYARTPGVRARVRDAVLQGEQALRQATCLGSNYVLRRSALESVGGFEPGSTTATAALRLSEALRADRWQTRYVSRQLADGQRDSNRISRISEAGRRAATELALVFRPGLAGLHGPARVRFHLAWIGLHPLTAFGLPASVGLLVAFALLGTPEPAWGLNLALHLAPYLGLRMAVWLMVAQPGLDLERAPAVEHAPRSAPAPWPREIEPVERREPRARTRPRSEPWVLRPELVLAVAAWAATACAIGTAAADVIQRNPPIGSPPLAKASAPPYSYFSPVRTPGVKGSPGR
jgi:cellulose synthase (UDP-forming)